MYIYITHSWHFKWRQCPTPKVFAQKSKINLSDIGALGCRTISDTKKDKWKRPLTCYFNNFSLFVFCCMFNEFFVFSLLYFDN